MSHTLSLVLWPLFAYLLGSVSSAILVSKLFRLDDPRQTGSGNPGATNVLRSGNKVAGLLTLIGDVTKGVIPVLLAMQYGQSNSVVALTAIAAFAGHLYPLYFGFKGGKGVATAIGIYFTLAWQLGAVFIAFWIITALISRYSSLASMLASGVTGLAAFAIFDELNQRPLIGAVALIVAFTFQRHRENIERLKTGKESKIGAKGKK